MNLLINTDGNVHGGFLPPVGLGTEGISKSSGIGARFQTARFRRAAGLLSVGEVEAAGIGTAWHCCMGTACCIGTAA